MPLSTAPSLRADGAPWCKICGITSPAHAALCADLGVDAIGLAFVAESPRAIDLMTAEAVAAARSPARVGLFVDPDPVWVREAITAARLDYLQFNGDEAPDYCESFDRPYLRAVRMRPGVDVAETARRYSGAAALLLDTYSEVARGGTGERFDWSLWPEDMDKPLILAGGLTPENVATAITQLKPSGVDVSGGVEAKRGVKDPDLIKHFVREVKHVQ